MKVAPNSACDSHSQGESIGKWVWFLPAAYVCHAAEEAFVGNGIMEWMAAGGGVRLSLAAFVGLNLVGAGMMCLAAWAARKSKIWRWPCVAGATVIFVNGVWHAAICVMTRSYIPGVGTGILLYVPIGAVLLFRLRRLISPRLFASAIVIGVVIHGATLWIVLRMPGFQMGR